MEKIINNNKYKGTIKVFKETFGFITSVLGDTYFSTTGLCEDYESPHKGDEVEFEIEPSKYKIGANQACKVVLIKVCDTYSKEISLQNDKAIYKENDDNREIGAIKWFEQIKGFGVISTVDAGEFFLRKEQVLSKCNLENGDIVVFTKVYDEKGRNIAKKTRLVSRSSDFSLALKYLGCGDDVIIEKYRISTSISLIESTYMVVLECAEYQNTKEQKHFLLNVAFWTRYTEDYQMYENAKKQFTNIMISESEIEDFIKYSCKKANNNVKLKFLITGTIQERTEVQSELLIWFIENNPFDYSKTKQIIQSGAIDDTIKVLFLKNSFEKAGLDYKYKMLFDDCLIDMTKETVEKQTILLQNLIDSICESRLNSWQHEINEESRYQKIKQIFFDTEIGNEVKSSCINYAFEKATPEWQYRLLFEDRLLKFNLLGCIKKYDLLHIIKRGKENFYNEKFEETYPSVSKIDRLYLWLNELNSHYDYFEFIQVAWQLSKDERRLFNKRVKDQAKDERLQKFIQQIPTAKVIDITEDAIIYNCRWRNIYFKDGNIIIFLSKEVVTQTYTWNFAREEFNFLAQEFFNNRKLNDLIVKIRESDNYIIDIKGLDDLCEKIVFAEVQKNASINKRTEISSNTLTKLIHNVSVRNNCIKLLSAQDSQFKAIDIQEQVSEQYGSLRHDVSFLFPIPDGQGNVYLVWESPEIEKSKATHIFRCSEDIVETLEEKIKEFIESYACIRSKLNSYSNQLEEKIENDITGVNHDFVDYEVLEDKGKKIKKEVMPYYYTRVNHDSFDYKVWEDRMKEVMPFLKRIQTS